MDIMDRLDDLSKPLLHAFQDREQVPPTNLERTDHFLCSIYDYYRRKGLYCILLDEILNILRVIFLALFIVYISLCVNFDWWNKYGLNNTKPITDDIFIPVKMCLKDLHKAHSAIIAIAVIYSLIKIGILVFRMPFLLKLKKFFTQKLQLNPSELGVTSWERIQGRLIEVSADSAEFNIPLDELLCHNMILRHTNFIVGLINCDILNFYINLPVIGKFGCFTNLMEIYLFKLFFPFNFFNGAIFSTRVNICELFRADNLSNYIHRNIRFRIILMSIFGLALSPFLFILQLLYVIFEYAEMIRQSPSSIFKYRWSRISYYSLRNYSEFDHELDERLNNAYPFASSYEKSFSSPLLSVLARHTTYFSGAVLLLFFVLTLLRDSFLQVNGIVTMIAITTGVYAFGNNWENERTDVVPEKYMKNITANIYHFTPDYDKPFETYAKFKMLFQSHFIYLLEQVAAPFTVPLVFLFKIRRRIPEIIKFVTEHTVNTNVGDMCEYALLDMKLSGRKIISPYPKKDAEPAYVADDKVEISLMAFSRNNANWNPPDESKRYLESVKDEAFKYMSCSRGQKPFKNYEICRESNQPTTEANLSPSSRMSDMHSSVYSDLCQTGVSHELYASIIYSRIRKKNLQK